MPQKTWGVLGGLVITAICPVGQLHAAQEPIMRVLVLESKQLRFRADGDKPLLVFGIGLNNFTEVCKSDKFVKTLKGIGCVTHPHNFYLQWLVETGPIGLFLFIL